MSREEWLAYRRNGIGGSDAAAIMGISPFRTARDIYYDKLNVASQEMGENWVALEIGHLLEDLVARIFAKKTGLHVYQVKKMYQHPLYLWMLADVDYFAVLPNGKIAIVEIKTTNFNARSHWWGEDGSEIIPEYYVAQVRHYMAVMNLDEAFICCLYGNNEDEVIIRHLARDLTCESELIFNEECFWKENVLAHVPPAYTEDGDLIQASINRTIGNAPYSNHAVKLSDSASGYFEKYLELQGQKSILDSQVNDMEKELKRLKALITAEMGTNSIAICNINGDSYRISNKVVRRTEVKKDNILRLKTLYPEVYDACVTNSEYRRFHFSIAEADAA